MGLGLPDEPPEYQLSDRLRRLVVCWEELPFNRPGSDKTWVERSVADYEAVIRDAVLLARMNGSG